VPASRIGAQTILPRAVDDPSAIAARVIHLHGAVHDGSADEPMTPSAASPRSHAETCASV
jgi:hypothetical protein